MKGKSLSSSIKKTAFGGFFVASMKRYLFAQASARSYPCEYIRRGKGGSDVL